MNQPAFRAYRIHREVIARRLPDGGRDDEVQITLFPLPGKIWASCPENALDMAKLDDPFPLRLCVGPWTPSESPSHDHANPLS